MENTVFSNDAWISCFLGVQVYLHVIKCITWYHSNDKVGIWTDETISIRLNVLKFGVPSKICILQTTIILDIRKSLSHTSKKRRMMGHVIAKTSSVPNYEGSRVGSKFIQCPIVLVLRLKKVLFLYITLLTRTKIFHSIFNNTRT